MVTRKVTSKDEEENVIMSLLILVGSYVGAGFLTTYQTSKFKKKKFEVDWTNILKWPADVFGAADPEDKKE